jgi:hypothetical protein
LNPAFEPEEASHFDKGAAAHALLLGRGRAITVVDAPDWRTKAAKEAREAARADGKTPVLGKDYAVAVEMAREVRNELALTPGCERAFVEGDAERVLIWQEPCGIWCRAMLDWMEPDGTVWDLKTSAGSAHPLALGRKAADMGWDVKQAFYQRGLEALKIPMKKFHFVVQENYEPFAVSVMELDAEALHYGRRKVEAAILMWNACLRSNAWPSYPRMIHRAEMPAYALAREEQREVSREGYEFAVRSQEPV